MDISDKISNFINEVSYTQKDIPKYFYVVFDINESIDELKNRKLKNLKGISSSNEIEFQFLGVARNAMLKMDSKKLLQMNNITRIMYDNPHYLVDNNLYALRRIYNARGDWESHVYGNIFEYFQKEAKKYSNFSQLYYDMEYYGFRNVYPWPYKKKVKNIYDLAKIIKKYVDEHFSEKTGIDYSNLNIKDYEKITIDCLKIIGKIYSDEAEWIVKNDFLIIPPKSQLTILVNSISNFDQKIYKFITNYVDNKGMDNMDDPFELIELFNDIKEKFGIKLNRKDVNGYISKLKMDIKIESIKNIYQIEYVGDTEFEEKRSNYFKTKS